MIYKNTDFGLKSTNTSLSIEVSSKALFCPLPPKGGLINNLKINSLAAWLLAKFAQKGKLLTLGPPLGDLGANN